MSVFQEFSSVEEKGSEGNRVRCVTCAKGTHGSTIRNSFISGERVGALQRDVSWLWPCRISRVTESTKGQRNIPSRENKTTKTWAEMQSLVCNWSTGSWSSHNKRWSRGWARCKIRGVGEGGSGKRIEYVSQFISCEMFKWLFSNLYINTFHLWFYGLIICSFHSSIHEFE